MSFELLMKKCVKLRELTWSEQGQDLVEYALLCTLIALTLVAGIGHIATAVNNTFTNISSSLA